MAHVLSAVKGDVANIIPVTRALMSVSDKSKIEELASFLQSKNVEIISTGGTAKNSLKAVYQ